MLQSLSLLAYLGRQLQVVVNFEDVLSAVLPSVFSPGSMHLLLGSVYTVMEHPGELDIDIKRGLMVTLVSIINWYTHPTQTPIDADHAVSDDELYMFEARINLLSGSGYRRTARGIQKSEDVGPGEWLVIRRVLAQKGSILSCETVDRVYDQHVLF